MAGTSTANARFARGLARAYTGAIIFGLPLLMTAEMWSLGFVAQAGRLALLVVLFFPFLVLLSWHAGFEDTFSWKNDVVDALVAFWVGVSSSAVVLALLGALDAGASAREFIGTLALVAVPCSIGALLAQSMLGEERPKELGRGEGQRYLSELFIMLVGALFFAFNIAPTQEMLQIAARIGTGHTLALVAVSLVTMHALVYAVEYRGAPGNQMGHPHWNLFLRFTVVGYALTLALCAYLMWTFGRLEGLAPLAALKVVVVLAFPASFGAASARMVL